MANEMRDRLKTKIEIARNDWWEKVGHNKTSKASADYIADYLLDDGWRRPPCKVGDTVYYINRFYHIELRKDTIYKAKVVRIVTNSLGTSLVIQIRGEHGCTELSNIDCVETPNIEDFSKTVFLTKEQAEQKLKEMRGE